MKALAKDGRGKERDIKIILEDEKLQNTEEANDAKASGSRWSSTDRAEVAFPGSG